MTRGRRLALAFPQTYYNDSGIAVGVLLTSFGIFWGAEGAQARWPGADAALLGVIATVLAVALILTAALRRLRAPVLPEPVATSVQAY